MVLATLLVTLTVLGMLLVLGPLVVLRRGAILQAGRAGLGIVGYFVAVGLGFMLFEISFIQRFALFLGYPTYSLTVTLFALLVFLGCGSRWSRRWVGRDRVVLPFAVVAVTLLALGYTYGLPVVQVHFLGSPLAVRVALTIAMIAPLGVVLGLFLPLGIRRAVAVHEQVVPWAWGVNGCASVAGGVLSIVLAATVGFRIVWALSVAIYALGVTLLLWSHAGEARRPELGSSTRGG